MKVLVLALALLSTVMITRAQSREIQDEQQAKLHPISQAKPVASPKADPATAAPAKDEKPPVIADADKAQLAIYERDLAQIQTQMKDLQSSYQQTAQQAQSLIMDINKKAGEGWQVNAQTFQFTKTTPEPKK